MAANLCCALESPREILRLPVLGLHSDQFNHNVQGWSQASVFVFLKRSPGDLDMKDLGSIAMSDTQHTSIKPGSPHPFFHGCHRDLPHNLQGPVQSEDGGPLFKTQEFQDRNRRRALTWSPARLSIFVPSKPGLISDKVRSHVQDPSGILAFQSLDFHHTNEISLPPPVVPHTFSEPSISKHPTLTPRTWLPPEVSYPWRPLLPSTLLFFPVINLQLPQVLCSTL